MPELLVKPEDERKFWHKIEAFSDPEKEPVNRIKARDELNKIIKHYVERPFRQGKKKLQAFKQQRQRLQAFNGITNMEDLPSLFTDTVSVYMDSDQDADLYFNALFEEVRTTPGLDYFEISDVKSGVKWKRLKEGERVELNGFTGDSSQIFLERFGAAIGVSEETIRYKKMWKIIDDVKEFRFAYINEMGDVHGVLLDGAAQLGVSANYYQQHLSSAPTLVEKDLETLNSAGSKMVTQLSGRPYGNMAYPSLILLADPSLRGRLNKVLNTLIQPVQGSANALDWNISVLYTTNKVALPDKNRAKLILPYRKIKMGIEEELRKYAATDPFTLTHAMACYSWRGAGIGDNDQIMEVRFA
ncbi:hypothetical protein [Leptospira santarosai]|uniref:hypothetical protein n=1 Tax=Leptospira santarosai TaxID=28183 RepID=UPI0002BF79A2|nr:hypothetical protein [Leptospira santarosai]EMO12492.1 hypothetical protein LEP1GSC165_0035 [Leptospira santarosai str. CBC523]MDI7183590.1 hypothetical protein [Leptospira santarosai]